MVAEMMDVDCDLSADIKNKSSARVDFRTDLATYLNIAEPGINSSTTNAGSLDISDAIDLDDYSSLDASEYTDSDDDVKITLVQKKNKTKNRKYNNEEPINVISSSEEDEVIVKKSTIIICSDDEDEVKETVRGLHVNTVWDCVKIQNVNIPCDIIFDCLETVVKEIVDKLVKDVNEILQQESVTRPEEEKVDNKTVIICSNKDEIKDNFRENISQFNTVVEDCFIQNVNFLCDNNSTEIAVKKIVEKLIKDVVKLLDEECQMTEEEKVIDNKTIVISSDKHQIREGFKENLSHCNTFEDCVIIQNVNCPCDNSPADEVVVKKIVDKTTMIIQNECEVDDEVDWSSSDNCLPQSKSATLPSILQEKPEVNNPIHKITNEVSSEEILVDNTDDIVLTTDVHLNPVGVIDGVVEKTVIVHSNEDTPALDFESAFFFEDRVYMGKIFETFGPVKGPYYTVNLSSRIDVSKLGKGIKVFFAPFKQEFTKYVFVEKLKKQKGSDASWKNDCEPPSEFLDHSDDEEESHVRREQENQSSDNTKKDNTFGQTPQQYNGNMEKHGKSRQNPRRSNQRLQTSNYNQTRNKNKEHNFHISDVHETQQPRFSNNFTQIPPAKVSKPSPNQLNSIPQPLSPSFDIARKQQVYLPQQIGLSSNGQRASSLLPAPSQPRPAYITPLDAHLERFPIVNNLSSRTDISASSNGDMPSRNGLLPFVNVAAATAQPTIRNSLPPFVNNVAAAGQPLISALHQNLFPPPAVNTLPTMQHPQINTQNFLELASQIMGPVNTLPNMQQPPFHNRDFRDIPRTSQNMGPANNRHGKIVNLNGFRLRR